MFLTSLVDYSGAKIREINKNDERLWFRIIIDLCVIFTVLAGFLITFLAPFALAGWLIYHYYTAFAPNHNLVGTGIIGGTLLKIALTFLPGIIKSIVTGTFFAWLLRTIRRQPPKPSDA
jgi:hypothetical protein